MKGSLWSWCEWRNSTLVDAVASFRVALSELPDASTAVGGEARLTPFAQHVGCPANVVLPRVKLIAHCPQVSLVQPPKLLADINDGALPAHTDQCLSYPFNEIAAGAHGPQPISVCSACAFHVSSEKGSGGETSPCCSPRKVGKLRR